MISVLIPVYNHDISNLVTELDNQFSKIYRDYEIVVLDDGSGQEIRNANQIFCSGIKHTIYLESDGNKGRIASRNKLAEIAKYQWLLFIDADSLIVRPNFISSYLLQITKETDVVVGGRIYQETEPSECLFRLHWRYGSEREVVPTDRRIIKPYAGFMSNNFIINRNMFTRLELHDELKGYGHEDTWIGIQLENLNAKIRYIDNPILHSGLEQNQTFISKSLNSLHNLKRLNSIVEKRILRKHVKLFDTYLWIRRLGATGIFLFMHSIFKVLIHRNLNSCSPSLFLFDCFRMNAFIKIMKESND